MKAPLVAAAPTYVGDSQAGALAEVFAGFAAAGLCSFGAGTGGGRLVEVTVRSTLERFYEVWCPVALVTWVLPDPMMEGTPPPLVMLTPMMKAGWVFRDAGVGSWFVHGPFMALWADSRVRPDAVSAKPDLAGVIADLGVGCAVKDGVLLTAAEAHQLRDVLHTRRARCQSSRGAGR